MKKLRKGFLFVLGMLLFLIVAAALWLLPGMPLPDSLTGHLHIPSIRITDRNGRLLYEVLPDEGGRHTVVPIATIPLALQQATVATEDRYFYQNPGVDFIGILRAGWITLRGGEAGGSTITQQVVRNLLLDAGERGERTLRRKLREIILAAWLTQRYSKEEILALYLNQTYYGGMAYGVEAAAQTFFGKSVSDLDVAECALLAGLPQAPARYNPFTDPEAAAQRQRVVLGLMEEQGYLTAEQRLLAEREALTFASTPYPIEAPHFVMMVRAQLDQRFTPQEVYDHGGLIVRTTLDLDWQHQAERAIRTQIDDLRRQAQGTLGHNLNSAALVALDPHSGEILALVGSPDYFDAEHDGALNMALSPRQPGSSIKPIVYAIALDPSFQGAAGQPLSGGSAAESIAAPWTAATMILDVQTTFTTHEGDPYIPANYDGLEHGPVLVRQALASSLNIPAVKTLHYVGLNAFFEQAARMGLDTFGDPDQYDLSLALGGGAVRLIDLTAAYGAFANGGYRVIPVAILEVADPQGEVLYRWELQPQPRVLDARVAWLISDILSDNDARRLGFGPNSILRLDRPAAVKTGTTSNFHDNWTIGYTPSLVVGVWAGNVDYQPMRDITGLTGAAPIWHQFIRAVLTGTPEETFSRPPGLVRVEVCAISGLLPTPACPYRRWEWFIQGTQPTQPDHTYRKVTVDSATGQLANAATPTERRITVVALDLPPEAAAWAHAQGLLLLSDLAASSLTNPTSLALTNPTQGVVYHLAGDIPLEQQRIRLAAVVPATLKEVTFWVDGVPLATMKAPPYEAWWQLTEGAHQAWVEGMNENGERVTSPRVGFEVLPSE